MKNRECFTLDSCLSLGQRRLLLLLVLIANLPLYCNTVLAQAGIRLAPLKSVQGRNNSSSIVLHAMGMTGPVTALSPLN